jgi:hypothetical protein
MKWQKWVGWALIDPLRAGLLRSAALRPAIQVVPGPPIDAPAFDPTTFTKNRERLLAADIADRFFQSVVAQARLRRYTSSEQFSVDGTLLEAWASHKSFKPTDDTGRPTPPAGRNTEVDFRGQPRSNRTHRSTTDPEALLARKSDGAPAKLSYAGHVLQA